MQLSTSHRRRTIYVAGAIALATLGAACSLRPQAAAVSSPARGDRAALDAFMKAQGFGEWTYVRPATGNRSPRYPEALRQSQTEGRVLAQFVVDTAGRVDVQNPITILASTNELFSASVRETLPSMRFVPSVVDGRKVKQLAQVPFEFRLANVVDVPGPEDSAHRSVHCGRGECPVLRLAPVVATIAP